MNDLKAKVKNYQAQIDQLEARIKELNETNTFERMEIIEAESTIKDYIERIERLERRITGMPEPGAPMNAQVRRSEWVLSDNYDNE